MLKPKWIVGCLLLLSVPAIAGTAAPDDDLPAGPMQSKARTGCTICHDSHIIVQQRLSKPAWGKEVDKMIKWGAIVNAADRDALVDYFSSNFSVDKPPYVAKRSAPAKR